MLTILGCRRSRTPPSTQSALATERWFDDITERSGLNFIHDVGPLGSYRFPQIMGSGAAMLDYDRDGRLDIYLIQNAGQDPKVTNRLFHQEPDGTFRDVSEGSGLDVSGYGMGVAVGDVNNDGYPDVLVTEYGGVRLFLNNGNGTFREVTKEAGLAEPRQEGPIRPWPMSAMFIDYDGDGWLDLVVTQYIAYDPSRSCTGKDGKPDYCGPNDFAGSVTRLYHNRHTSNSTGNHGVPVFEDVTAAAGLAATPTAGLGIAAVDMNVFGNVGILIANDGKPNNLWLRQPDGTFRDDGGVHGIAYAIFGQPQGNMGIAIGDVYGGGSMAIYITHLTEENNTLWRRRGAGYFFDTTAGSHLMGQGQGTGFGTVLADFNNDGVVDLAVVNGRVVRGPQPVAENEAPELSPYWRGYAQRNQLFANDGYGHFTEIGASNSSFCGSPNVGRALVAGSIFNDGGIDLLLTTAGGRARLFRNVATNRGHWLIVRATDPKLGGRDVYGAHLTLAAADQNLSALIQPAYSYLSSNDPRAHFGLGKITSFHFIEVLWPDGIRERFPGGRVDRIVELKKGEGSEVETGR